MLATAVSMLCWLVVTEIYVDYRARMRTLEVMDGQERDVLPMAVIYFGLVILLFLFWRQGTT